MLTTIWKDVQHGARVLVKNPGFALIAMASIAIGVGANAAMFSLADTLVLRPLTVPHASDILTVAAVSPKSGFLSPNASALSYPEFEDLRDQTRSFASLMAFRLVVVGVNERRDQPAQRRFGIAVSANLFDGLAAQPALGRSFSAEEERVPGRDHVIVLDHDFWARRFNSDRSVVGQRITLSGIETTIIGVMPPEFTGPDQFVHPAFYVPLSLLPRLFSLPSDELVRRDLRNVVVKGRLKPGVTFEQARTDVEHLGTVLQASYPATNRERGLTVKTELGSRIDARPQFGVLVAMLVTLALAMLFVACANVAGLLTSRAPARAREMALRLAIGAGRPRLIRQLLIEGLLLAAGGGAAGLLVGQAGIALFARLDLPTDVPLKFAFELDQRVLTVGVAVAALSALASSLMPAWHATRVDLVTTLKSQVGEDARRTRLWGRNLLVCGQVAISMMLLTVSVFLYRAYSVEIGHGPGFRTAGVLLMSFDPNLAGYDDEKSAAFYDRLVERARTLPGVTSVALTSSVPMDAISIENSAIAPEGVQLPTGTTSVRVRSARVDPGYFNTLAITIVDGRAFRTTDTSSTPPVAIVNRTFASRYWPGQNAIGKRFRLDDASAWTEIVGVAADHKYRALSEGPTEFVYFPQHQRPVNNNTLLVQTAGDPSSIAAGLRQVVQSLDPSMTVTDIRTLNDFYRATAVTFGNLIVEIVGAMGSVGLMLALVGLYGLVAFSVSRRRREIGIRMAVGARPHAVLRMIMRDGLRLAAIGTVMGLVVSAAMGGLLRAAFPFPSVPRIDIVTYALVVPAIVVVTLLAAFLPARRAARIDPLVTLRAD